MIPISEKTTYQIDMDTQEAQKKVEELDEGTKKLSDRMQAVGTSGRSIGDGISNGVGQGMGALNSLGNSMVAVGSAAEGIGSAGMVAGNQMRSGFESAAEGIGRSQSSLGNLEVATDTATQAVARLSTEGMEAGEKIGKAFQNAASESDNLGISFAKNYSKAAQAGEGFAKSIKTGIVGAVDTAKKKTDSFIKETVTGAKKMGDAFSHPVKTLKDKLTAAMSDAAKSTKDVGKQAKDSQKSFDNMGKAGQDAGGKLKSGLTSMLGVLGAVAVGVAAVTGLTKFVSSALEASQSAQVIQHSFEQTFGEGSVDVEAWADNFSNAVHRSESQVKSFLTTNHKLFQEMGVTGAEAEALSKAATSLAYDIGNFAGIDDAQALQKVQDAIKGNKDALSEYGVTLDENRLKQTALNMGLSGNLEALDQSMLAQVRFNSILEQTESIQGNASSSLGGLSGGIKAMQALYTDFLEKVGAKLAPTFDKLFGTVLDMWPQIEPALMDFVDLLGNGFEQAAPIITEFASYLLPELLELAMDIFPLLADMGGDILPLLASTFGVLITAAKPLLPVIANLAMELLPPLVKIIEILINGLLPPLSQLFESFGPILLAVAPALDIVASAISFVCDAIATLIGWLTTGIEKVAEFGQKVADSPVGKLVSGAGSLISGVFSGHAKGTDDFEGGWTQIHEAGNEIIENRQESGIAYLPKGSAIIPASKTEQILSKETESNVVTITNLLTQADPVDWQSNIPEKSTTRNDDLIGPRGWIPTLIENRELLNSNTKDNGEDDNKKPDSPDGGGTGPDKPPPPPPSPISEDATHTPKKVIEINVNISVSSPDGTVTPEVLEQFREIAKDAAKEAYEEIENDKYTDLAIQDGLVG